MIKFNDKNNTLEFTEEHSAIAFITVLRQLEENIISFNINNGPIIISINKVTKEPILNSLRCYRHELEQHIIKNNMMKETQ